jgi:tetratricopeptide (TPR) repeat protein
MSLGRLGEAPPYYERAVAGYLAGQDWHSASIGYQNLAELYAHLGELTKSAQAAQQALDLARRAENKRNEPDSLAYQAWAAHLHGELEAASAAFAQAEVLQREIDPTERYLYSLRGIQHADHLRRTGQSDYAHRVSEANLEICKQYNVSQASQCHRVLGDLDADAGQLASARGHYDEALKIARSISFRPALIEALLARGRFFARCPDLEGFGNLRGLDDLNEALGYALAGGYRRYEADIRVALAWAHLNPHPHPPPSVTGEGVAQARAEAERALQMSEAMGYYWGKVDAQEVLSRMAG